MAIRAEGSTSFRYRSRSDASVVDPPQVRGRKAADGVGRQFDSESRGWPEGSGGWWACATPQ